MKRKNKLAEFAEVANDKEWALLARRAGTTTNYLEYLARQYGRRKINVCLAVKIEQTTTVMNQANPALPIVTCEDLCALSK